MATTTRRVSNPLGGRSAGRGLDVDEEVLGSLDAASMSVAVTTLVNDVTRACDHAPATQWMMVLDDYHAIGRPTYTKRHCSSSTTCPPTSPRQPDEIRDFLLRTAVLDQVSGPLCDAVTGRTGGTATLEDLERGNLSSGPVGHPAHLVSLPPHVSPTCFVHVCSLSTPRSGAGPPPPGQRLVLLAQFRR